MFHSFPNLSCSGCYYDSQDPTTSHQPSSPSWGVSSLPVTRPMTLLSGFVFTVSVESSRVCLAAPCLQWGWHLNNHDTSPVPHKTALLCYPYHLAQNTGMHWRQEIKREILLSQGQNGVSSSLRESSLTKGKASWFGWVSPEEINIWKRWFLQENTAFLLAQQVHTWLPPCPMAEAGDSAAAGTPVLALATAPAPRDRHWSCWAVVVYSSSPALPGLLFPLITLFRVCFLESLLPGHPLPAPFMCTSASSKMPVLS